MERMVRVEGNTMAQESISLPKAMFTGLELDDGDVVSGRTRDNLVELRVVRRSSERGHAMTGERFVAKWHGQFPDVAADRDPRLESLLKKHLRS